ncbi:MAG: hypothetical protein WD800_05605 [Dehalococcoidia bacterium]
MIWFALRAALALYLITRPSSGRVSRFAGGMLLPGPLRLVAGPLALGKSTLDQFVRGRRGL